MQPYIRSTARTVDRSLALKYNIRFQTIRADTVRGCPFRASATSRGNSTEHPQDHHNTRRTPVHREVRPSVLLPACSPRRVRARRRGQFAFKMRFRIANPYINRSGVNCDQVSFWYQKTKRTTFQIHHIALSADVLFRLTLPRTRLFWSANIKTPGFSCGNGACEVRTRTRRLTQIRVHKFIWGPHRVWYRRYGIESRSTNQNCPFRTSHRPTRRLSDPVR